MLKLKTSAIAIKAANIELRETIRKNSQHNAPNRRCAYLRSGFLKHVPNWQWRDHKREVRLGLAPELVIEAYGASKAFVVAITPSMRQELLRHGIYVQLVLATARPTWSPPDCEPEPLPGLMIVADLVDGALVGFDQREAVTSRALRIVAG